MKQSEPAHIRPGIQCNAESLKEHLKAFSDMEDCFVLIDKQQSSLLTKTKKRATISKTKKAKEKPECQENHSSTRKKQSKK